MTSIDNDLGREIRWAKCSFRHGDGVKQREVPKHLQVREPAMGSVLGREIDRIMHGGGLSAAYLVIGKVCCCLGGPGDEVSVG